MSALDPLGAFHFGTSGRNILDGPGTLSLNMGLSRRFRLLEMGAVQFRCEAFNATNHTNLDLPQTNVDVLKRRKHQFGPKSTADADGVTA